MTVWGPIGAAELIFTTAVALVAEVTVNDATVTPDPKLAVVDPWIQFVDCPVRVTERFCWPCCPLLGVTETRMDETAVTVKPLESVSTSLPVVIVTVCAPVVAVGLMFNVAVALVEEFTVSDATVMPAPKLAVVVPCTQFVYSPKRATDRFC